MTSKSVRVCVCNYARSTLQEKFLVLTYKARIKIQVWEDDTGRLLNND